MRETNAGSSLWDVVPVEPALRLWWLKPREYPFLPLSMTFAGSQYGLRLCRDSMQPSSRYQNPFRPVSFEARCGALCAAERVSDADCLNLFFFLLFLFDARLCCACRKRAKGRECAGGGHASLVDSLPGFAKKKKLSTTGTRSSWGRGGGARGLEREEKVKGRRWPRQVPEWLQTSDCSGQASSLSGAVGACKVRLPGHTDVAGSG